MGYGQWDIDQSLIQLLQPVFCKIISGLGCRNRPDHPEGVCELWAREGHCQENADLMNQFCTPECCDITQSTTTTSTTTTTTTGNVF